MFREGMKESDSEKIVQLRKNAASYAELVSSVAELKKLRELDTGEKMGQRDTIQASAARVGLNVPSWADDPLPKDLPPKPTNPHLVGPWRSSPTEASIFEVSMFVKRIVRA